MMVDEVRSAELHGVLTELLNEGNVEDPVHGYVLLVFPFAGTVGEVTDCDIIANVGIETARDVLRQAVEKMTANEMRDMRREGLQ